MATIAGNVPHWYRRLLPHTCSAHV